MSVKQNCWEYKKCGRELYGKNTATLTVCPAALEKKLDNVHDGTNAGRACWVVAGTLCRGKNQGFFSRKKTTCMTCDFYLKVQAENFTNFQISVSLLKKLHSMNTEHNAPSG